MAIIGIDLGTTNSLAAVWKEGKSILIPNASGDYLTPSAVSIDDDGSVLIGRVAKERLISHPKSSATAFKRFMGTPKQYTLKDKTFAPEDLSSFVLRSLKQDAENFLGEEVTEAVISVPAYFNDSQRSATKRAGELAGLKVERLINEPSAAALACRMADSEEDKKFLVFDFGGGTLDVSIVDCFENIVSIIAVSGDNYLGGNDFDREIADAFCKENKLDLNSLTPIQSAVLLKQAERCKIALGRQEKVMMVIHGEELFGSLLLTNQKLIEIAAELFAKMTVPIRRALADSEIPTAAVDEIVLVGGSCKMPVISHYLAHLLHRKPSQTNSPDTMVALGTGVYAGMKERRTEIKEMLLTDICPFTLGIGTYNRSEPGRSIMSPIIERNSVLPTSKIKEFVTATANQREIQVEIFQGENYYCEDNLKLGEVEIKVPPAPKGEESVDVRFTYDINGILEAEVSSKTTGASKRTVIMEKQNGLSQQEVEQRLKELEALKIHPRDQEENRMLIARCQRLYHETLGETRERVGQAMEYFQAVLSKQEKYRIIPARKKVELLLEQIEDGLQFFDSFSFDPDEEM